MIEKPIERLSFYNGERLNADDFQLEQEYHIRVRRWLNKSLYSAGIAGGLEVSSEPGRVDVKGRPVILVSPGLALDNEGREMIVVEQAEVPILGRPNQPGQPVTGNYLYIQYSEEKRAEESENLSASGGRLAWGGPSRVRAEPVIGWSDDFPREGSGKVPLAQVQLDNNCAVQNILPYPRRYIGPASNAAVRQYALEGERNIDRDNPGRIYFHIRGRQPNAVTLYLRAEKFSTLFYTELGTHDHSADLGLNNITIPRHHHSLPTLTTDETTVPNSLPGNHSHSVTRINADADDSVWSHVGGNMPAVQVLINPNGRKAMTLSPVEHFHKDNPLGFDFDIGMSHQNYQISENNQVHMVIELDHGQDAGGHTHTLSSSSVNHTNPHPPIGGSDTELSLQFNREVIHNAGVGDIPARSEPDPTRPQPNALTYVDNLQIYIGRVDQAGMRPPSPGPNTGGNFKKEILDQLKTTQPVYRLKEKLGEGTGNETDPLSNNGTGAIRLDLLSPDLSFSEGEYYIDLAVPNESGGRILYNLYVE